MGNRERKGLVSVKRVVRSYIAVVRCVLGDRNETVLSRQSGCNGVGRVVAEVASKDVYVDQLIGVDDPVSIAAGGVVEHEAPVTDISAFGYRLD